MQIETDSELRFESQKDWQMWSQFIQKNETGARYKQRHIQTKTACGHTFEFLIISNVYFSQFMTTCVFHLSFLFCFIHFTVWFEIYNSAYPGLNITCMGVFVCVHNSQHFIPYVRCRASQMLFQFELIYNRIYEWNGYRLHTYSVYVWCLPHTLSTSMRLSLFNKQTKIEIK